MKSRIFCKTTGKGIHSFYLTYKGESYFLFNQDYRRGVNEHFSGVGLHIDGALNFSKANGDSALQRTIAKLPMYIKYVEKEYGICVLKQTYKKNQKFAGKRVAA